MRQFKLLLLAVIIGILFHTCNYCDRLECATDNYYGQFRIVRASDGNDLVFGPNKIYDKNQIKFYSLKGIDTIFLEYQPKKFPDTGYDSILYVRFIPDAETAYMRLSNGDLDTLNISYKTAKSRCCGTITEIENFRFNNSENIPGSKGTQALKK